MPDTPHIALITGATRGIGAAIGQALKAQGFTVIGTATTADGADKISAAGLIGKALNVTNASALDALVDETVKTHGGIHVLVNNAGITRDQLAMRMKDDDWDTVHDTNLKAVFRLCRAVMRPMMKQRYGRIINITSVVGASGNPGQANYAAAKAGLVGMSKSLSKELASRNVTVNCVAPGFISTDMTATLPEAQQQALMAQIPMGRMGRAEEIASAVAWLASPSASYITGQEIHVNGGMYA
jgi:3-oxoacyl-[acyl-carrier protein] reductase